MRTESPQSELAPKRRCGTACAVLLALAACGDVAVSDARDEDGGGDVASDGVADAPPIAAECLDAWGECRGACIAGLVVVDRARDCLDSAGLCVGTVLPTDGGACINRTCYVNLASGTIASTCATAPVERWRRCTADEESSVESVWRDCSPPSIYQGQVFY